METKLFEIRDRATFIPVLAIRFSSETEPERYLLSRAGYGRSNEDHGHYIMLCQINGGNGRCSCGPYDWPGRTYREAHNYIQENWSELPSGDVIDVECIVGDTLAPKISERLTVGD